MRVCAASCSHALCISNQNQLSLHYLRACCCCGEKGVGGISLACRSAKQELRRIIPSPSLQPVRAAGRLSANLSGNSALYPPPLAATERKHRAHPHITFLHTHRPRPLTPMLQHLCTVYTRGDYIIGTVCTCFHMYIEQQVAYAASCGSRLRCTRPIRLGQHAPNLGAYDA